MKEKYHRKLVEATITFRRDGAFYSCTVTYKAGRDRPNLVRHESTDIRNAFNGARRKLETQLKRIKVFKLDHHHPNARPDKDIQLDGEHRVSTRGVQPQVPEHDLTALEGADDYTKARMQQAAQEAARIRAEAERTYPMAAE